MLSTTQLSRVMSHGFLVFNASEGEILADYEAANPAKTKKIEEFGLEVFAKTVSLF